jgi:DNA-binding transcriptional LysR family regulator
MTQSFSTMDSINIFLLFTKVAEARSFVGAGQAVGLSASAIGKSIARLEERLGVRLLHRSTRSIALTAEGTMFLERCKAIVAELEAAEAELSQSTSRPSGRLRISLPLISEPFLQVVIDFKKAYPDVELDLDFTNRKVDVIEEGYDAVVRSGEVEDSRLTARRLGTFRMVAVGSPAYFKEHGRPERPADLVRHACIQFRFPNTGKLQAWDFKGPAHTDPIHIIPSVICNTLEARVAFALQGFGIAYLSDFAIEPFTRDGRLETVLDAHIGGGGVYHLLWPSGKNVTPRLRAFIDHFSANVPFHDRPR